MLSLIGHDLRETLKLRARTSLGTLGLSLGRDPYVHRLARTLEDHAITTVVDVGANVGQFATLLRAARYPGRILSYEPMADAFTRLRKRADDDSHWESYNLGVGRLEGHESLHVSANSYSSSILSMLPTHLDAAPDSHIVRTESIRLTTVEALMHQHRLDPGRTLLKIDTQGYETAVLDGAGSMLADMAAVQLELSLVPLYEGQALAAELTERMEALGLTLWSIEPGFSDQTGRMLQYDALFVRTASDRS